MTEPRWDRGLFNTIGTVHHVCMAFYELCQLCLLSLNPQVHFDRQGPTDSRPTADPLAFPFSCPAPNTTLGKVPHLLQREFRSMVLELLSPSHRGPIHLTNPGINLSILLGRSHRQGTRRGCPARDLKHIWLIIQKSIRPFPPISFSSHVPPPLRLHSHLHPIIPVP